MSKLHIASIIIVIVTTSVYSVQGYSEPTSTSVSTEYRKQYGRDIPKEGSILSLKQAIERLEQGESGLQKISGTVTKVCRQKGCWMILREDDAYARITFKDYKFFIPTDTANQYSIVYGELSEKQLSASMAKHYRDDERGDDERGDDERINSNKIDSAKAESEKVVAVYPVKEYSIIAEGVYIEDKTN